MIDKDKTKVLMEKSLEFIKDASTKIRKEAQRKWKISNLKLEIASQRHQKSLLFKDLGKYIYESTKADNLDNEKYEDFFIKIGSIEEVVKEKEELIKKIEEEAMKEKAEDLLADEEADEEIKQYTDEEPEVVEPEVITAEEEDAEKKGKKKLDKEAVDKESEIAGE